MYLFLKSILAKACFTSILFILPSSVNAQYTINSEHGDLAECDTMTRGIFIIWWDKDVDHSAQVDVMLDTMLAFQDFCLNNLGMQDPLGPLNGYYCNIYIHAPGNPDDYFYVNYPEWGNGVGGDINGYAFMTLPDFIIYNFRNLAHETFHIYQSHGMWDITPGIYSSDDGGWFVEATADWFATYRYPNDPYSFIGAEILVRVPQVPMWLDFYNIPPDYPDNWQRAVHQYAMGIFFYYLTNEIGILDSNIVSVFYSGTSLISQEYLYNLIGGSDFRNYFIDFAAHLTNDFDFITPEQADNSLAEWNWVADPEDDNQFIQTYNDAGSDGWFRPDDELTTTAWSFNTYKLLNTSTENYTFEINGDETGIFGDYAYFQGKVLVQNSVTGASFHNLVMSNDYQGALTLSLTPSDTAVYFIIASMPEVFEDSEPSFQLFPYEMKISTGNITGISALGISSPKIEIARYNILGQKMDKETGGLQFILYNDGSTEKNFIQQ